MTSEDEPVETVARKLANIRYGPWGGADSQSLIPGKPNWQLCRDDARAALSAIRDAGYAVVPVEPTREMILAAETGRTTDQGKLVEIATTYRAMIAAAGKETP